ncbi:hypothetical protein ACHQM5_021245 [Ranunculus cassubicifolius]
MPPPHRTRPLTALMVFMGVNMFCFSTITPVYDYRERRRIEREAYSLENSESMA